MHICAVNQQLSIYIKIMEQQKDVACNSYSLQELVGRGKTVCM